jgi:opacity protein-like surface antigen
VRKIKLLLFGVVLAALLALPAAAMAKSHDRDHDGLPDKWEHKFHLSTHHKSAKGDPDKDGLNNRGEFKAKTNPRKADTDRDGINDANDDQDNDGVDNVDEQHEGTNPRDSDTDNDGVEDGDEVGGTVDSFVEDSANPGTGVLTIKLADGSTISGKVDSSTEIECRAARTDDDANDDSATRERHGSDDGQSDDTDGDHSGPGRGGDDNEGNCTTADLTPGAAVHEAELNGTGADAVFEEVKLIK